MKIPAWIARHRSPHEVLNVSQFGCVIALDAELQKMPPAERAAQLRLVVQTVYHHMRTRTPGLGYYTTEARSFEPVVRVVEDYCTAMYGAEHPASYAYSARQFSSEADAASPIECATMLHELAQRLAAQATPGTPEAHRLPPVTDALAAYRATIEHDPTARTPKVA